MTSVPMKVLFIGGYGRSGSTLLDRVLGQIDGFFSAGELRHVFREGYSEDRLCGCGVPFRRCPFWNEVTDRAFGGMDAFDAAELLEVKDRVDRYWRIPQLVSGVGTRRRRRDLEWYLDRLRDLYTAIASVSGAEVIVDSSKDVSHGYVLGAIGAPVDPYVCHLVRDSRAVAHSWRRRKFNPGSGGDMDRYSLLRTAAEWVAINALTSLQRRVGQRYALLRYDDFASDPARAARGVLDLLGESHRPVPLAGGRTLEDAEHHTVAGNPVRFERGEIEIRPDERWRNEMPRSSRALVTALTLPTMVRYGFAPPLSRGAQAATGGARPSPGAGRPE